MQAAASIAPLPAFALIRREFVSELRRPRMFVVVGVAGAVGIAAVLLRWPEDVHSLRLASRFASGFFEAIAMLLMATAVCALPALSAGTIVVERERDTDELLRMSLVSSGGFVLAKSLSAFGHLATLMAGFAPIIAVVFFLSGIGLNRVGSMFGMLCVMSVMITAISLFCSACARRTLPAIVMSYAGVLIVMIAPIVVLFIGLALANAFGVPIRSLRGILAPVVESIMPIAAFVLLVRGDLQGTPLLLPVGIQLGWTAIFLTLTVMRVHRPLPPPRIETAESIDDPALLAARRKTFPFYLIDPLKRRPMIEDGRNPMLVREMRWGAMTRGPALVRLFYASFVVYLFGSAITLVASESATDIRSWVLIQMAITLLIAPAMLANAFTRERELGNMDMLRMTLLEPREIVIGKFFTGVLALVPLVLAALASSLLPVMIGVRDWDVLITGYLSLAACALLALALSIAVSLIARRTASAIALAYLATLFVFAGLSFVCEALLRLIRNTGGWIEPESVHGIASYVSPVRAYLFAMHWDRRTREFDVEYGYWVSNMAVTLALTAAIAFVTVRILQRFRMQDT